MLNRKFIICDKPFVFIPTGTYLVELQDILPYDCKWLADKLSINVISNEIGDTTYAGCYLDVFVNIPKDNEPKPSHKIYKIACALLAVETLKNLGAIEYRDLIGKKCWGYVEKQAATCEIKGFNPYLKGEANADERQR